jgi:predicted nucleic acid-binding protein
MKQLLDVSALLALIWKDHEFFDRADAWRTGQTLVLCPLAELGFLRVSTGPAANASMADARRALEKLKTEAGVEWIPDDLTAMDGLAAPNSKKTTDFYLGNLAQKHGLALATFDGRTGHPAAQPIP